MKLPMMLKTRITPYTKKELKNYEFRLLDAIRVMRKVVDDKKDFNMSIVKNSCGTTGCMMGWIASYPYASKKGLKLVPFKFTDKINIEYTLNDWHGKSHIFDGIEAVEYYFGISREEANAIFEFDNYVEDMSNISAKQALARITKYATLKGVDVSKVPA